MELREALDQISAIRQQMAHAQVFRGYRAATTAATAGLAGVAALAQARFVPDPARDIDAYLYLWCGTALLSTLLVGAEMALRSRRSGSSLQRQLTLVVVDQFVPRSEERRVGKG